MESDRKAIQSIFRRSGHRFVVENATKPKRLERRSDGIGSKSDLVYTAKIIAQAFADLQSELAHPSRGACAMHVNATEPVRYVAPVYRPPSEASSLILPVTDGCSWNRCTFCEMYTDPQKRFRPRSEEEVVATIRRCGETYGNSVRRVFLADGDAMTLSTRRLAKVLEAIRHEIPSVRRVSSYCLPRNLRKKSVAELRELAELGLSLVYVGAESGDDEVLARVQKGETFQSSRDSLEKLGDAGIKRSVMILNGLGGEALSRQHARNSAALMNATQPEYLATLVVSFPKGEDRLLSNFPDFKPLDIVGLMREMEVLISELELKRTVFRSDHASNWLIQKGTLGADKARLLDTLKHAIEAPNEAGLRPAWARGL